MSRFQIPLVPGLTSTIHVAQGTEMDFHCNALEAESAQSGCGVRVLESLSGLAKHLARASAEGERVRACVVLCLGSGFRSDEEERRFLASREEQEGLTAWVRDGGIIFFHGERHVTKVFAWFERPWCFSGDSYRRVEHQRGAEFGYVAPAYCVKACMLSKVDPSERVYYAGEGKTSQSMVPGFGAPVNASMCALALAPFGKGAVGFFGDVNAEKATFRTVLQLISEKLRSVDGGGGGASGSPLLG